MSTTTTNTATRLHDDITKALDAGLTVTIQTSLTATRITPRTAKKWATSGRPLFAFNKAGDLLMADGKGYSTIATPKIQLVKAYAN